MNLKDDIILIDKPQGWTSFDVVAKIRGKIRAEYTAKGEKPTKKQLRVGHAGTLDPFATGLVIILIGEACKKAGEFLKLDKTYEFTAKLGEVSTTGDPEGVITSFLANSKEQIANRSETLDLRSQTQNEKNPGVVIPGSTCLTSIVKIGQVGDSVNDMIRHPEPGSGSNEKTINSDVTLSAVEGSGGAVNSDTSTLTIPTKNDVKNALKQFEGVISQVPPAFSAIKINGKRAYKLAREGKVVEIPAREVTIYKIELVEYNFPYLKCICDVSSGTYIRTLVEDIGKILGVGAYCKQLRRTQIDMYLVADSFKIDKLLN